MEKDKLKLTDQEKVAILLSSMEVIQEVVLDIDTLLNKEIRINQIIVDTYKTLGIDEGTKIHKTDTKEGVKDLCSD
jgi:hypothetical protein